MLPAAQPGSSSKVKSGLSREVTPLKRKKIDKDALVKGQDNSHVQSPASAVNEVDKSDKQPRGKESDNTYVVSFVNVIMYIVLPSRCSYYVSMYCACMQ